MKRISVIIVATLTLALLVFANSRTPKAKSESDSKTRACAQTAGQTDRTVATQERINRYFHRDVIPKLRDCWKGVQGEGEIEIKLTYARAGGGWRSERVERSGSTLPSGQDAVALRCMQEAVRGTSFPVEGGDSGGDSAGGASGADKFVVHWSWPVPLPASSAEFAAKKSGGGSTGGCDGRGAKEKCWNCDGDKCKKVCVGYNACSDGYKLSTPCVWRLPACASGGPFGLAGGGIFIANSERGNDPVAEHERQSGQR